MEKEQHELPKLAIHEVEERDIPAVSSIARKLKIDVHNPNPAILGKGFLVYTLPPEGYAQRMNPRFLVAKEQDLTLGYLMCYDNKFLKRLIDDGSIGHEDGITRFITDLEPTDRYLYGDQIGIDYEHHRIGVGSTLMQRNFEQMRRDGIEKMYVAILHGPIKNDASILFCSRLGANCVGEVANKDGITWGMYRFVVKAQE